MMHQDERRSVASTAPATLPSLDTFLFERALQGDHEAFAKLLEPHERVIFVSAMGILNNESDAERAAGEAVLKAFRTLGKFLRTANFRTWLVRMVIDEAKSMLPRDERELCELLGEGPRYEEYVPRMFETWRRISPSNLAHRELREPLQAALKSLPGNYRVVIALRDIAHLSIADTADVLGLTEDNVKTRLCRARLQIRETLAGSGKVLSR